jgi:hypothetical protein
MTTSLPTRSPTGRPARLPDPRAGDFTMPADTTGMHPTFPINLYTVRSRNKFKTDAGGSIDLYIQKDSPGKDKESNWLPAPEGEFVLMMRLYWPKEKPPSTLDGSWKLPHVAEVK